MNTVTSLLSAMRRSNIQWALAVGMGASIGGYNEDSYASFIRGYSSILFPIAFVDFGKLDAGLSVVVYLRHLRSLGYFGIKIHPRLSEISIPSKLVVELIKEANNLGLLVLLCTYFWSNKASSTYSPERLSDLLSEVPNAKLILLHGGGVRLLEVAEVARQFREVLLDLSFTICKYEGSSIDLDIRYLFEKFDRRLCIGSDSPEYGPDKLRERFDKLSEGLDQDKMDNIGYANLARYARVEL